MTECVKGHETIGSEIGVAGDTSVKTEFFGMTEVGDDGDGDGDGDDEAGLGTVISAPALPFRSIDLSSLFIVFSFFTLNGLRLL